MAKNKLLATEPAGDAALLNGQPVKEKHESIWKDVFAGIVSNKASLVSGIFILILAAIAIVTKLAPGILPYDPYAQNLGESLLGPSAQHWFGTDIQGRDIFCRVLVGTQITLTVGLAAVAISLTVGVILGSIAGYKGGKWDTVIMRIMDMMLAIPSILLAIAIMAALGPGIEKAVVAIGLVAIPEYARRSSPSRRTTTWPPRASSAIPTSRSCSSTCFPTCCRPSSSAPRWASPRPSSTQPPSASSAWACSRLPPNGATCWAAGATSCSARLGS